MFEDEFPLLVHRRQKPRPSSQPEHSCRWSLEISLFRHLSNDGLQDRIVDFGQGQISNIGLSQLLRQASQTSKVEIAMGLRFRLRTWLSHHFACSRNVTPFFCFTTSLKYSTVSAPLFVMISRARRSLTVLDRLPGPDIGQILSRMCFLFSSPGTSIHHRTTHHLPLDSCDRCSDQFCGTCSFLSALLVSQLKP